MDKATRTNPKTWGLTEQEMRFADAYVFAFFHCSAVTAGMAEGAAEDAGYNIPVNYMKAHEFVKALQTKCQKYIDAEIERFREILSAQQCVNLWKHISDFECSTPDDTFCGGTAIILH